MAETWHGLPALAARAGSLCHRVLAISLFVWAGLFCSTALADADQISQWFNDLDHPEADTRESARISLMGLDRPDLDDLQQVVEQGRPLRPSQAAVLREIVAQAYLAGEPYEAERAGFLGVNLSDVQLTAGDPQTPDLRQATAVVIVNRVPGFIGNRLLMDGDIVLGVDGQPVIGTQDLVDQIRTRGPGTTVTLRLLRAGSVIEVPIRLDARPIDMAGEQQAERLRQVRERKFEAYWQRTFAPLLRERLSLGQR